MFCLAVPVFILRGMTILSAIQYKTVFAPRICRIGRGHSNATQWNDQGQMNDLPYFETFSV